MKKILLFLFCIALYSSVANARVNVDTVCRALGSCPINLRNKLQENLLGLNDYNFWAVSQHMTSKHPNFSFVGGKTSWQAKKICTEIHRGSNKFYPGFIYGRGLSSPGFIPEKLLDKTPSAKCVLIIAKKKVTRDFANIYEIAKNSATNYVNKFSNYSDLEMCKLATVDGKGKDWVGGKWKSNSRQFLNEVYLTRKLLINDCDKLINGTITTQKDPSKKIYIDQEKMIYGNFDDYGGNTAFDPIVTEEQKDQLAQTPMIDDVSNRKDKFVCARATKSHGLMWETTNPKFTAYVDEARKRNLSLKDCNKLTGRGDTIQDPVTEPGNTIIAGITKYFSPKPKTTVQVPKIKVDKDAPVLEIEDRITVTDRTYTISGRVTDTSDVFIEIDEITVPVKNNKFTLNGSSSIGLTEYKIVAFDKWGNETRKNIMVERVIQTVNNDNSFEPLKPETLETKRNKNRIALIIGMEEYDNMSSANYAQRDAELFIDYVQGAFGVPQSNIKYFINAENEVKFDIKSWLKKNVRNNTEVYVYFSGHGIALNNGQDLYLLTNDTRTQYIRETAFNRNEIFNDIAQYNPKSVTAFLDTCYSGAGRADGEMLLAMAKGLVVVDEQQQQLPNNFTLFTAASAQESAWSLPEAQHGTFSYFLMKGMEGEADLNSDKKLTNGELQEYLLENVGRFAQQQQTPQMIGDPNQVLVQF